MQRRHLILMQAASALAASGGASATADRQVARPPGRPGDFSFLTGEWRIANRRLKAPGEWDEFPGEATVLSLLGGTVSIEELRIPTRNFAGMGLRVLDPKAQLWRDLWMNVQHGIVEGPGMAGHFQDGAGIFEADERDGETPIRVRGIWDQITPTGCRWRQAVSRDGGQRWETTWSMNWTRA